MRNIARTQEQEAQVASGVAAERLKLLNDMKSSLWALNNKIALTEDKLTLAEEELVEESQLRDNLERLQEIKRRSSGRGPWADVAVQPDGQ